MGLDSIELLTDVEQTFGIKIPDEEAVLILTVGDFYEAVWRQVSSRKSSFCRSQIVFYTLRKHFFKLSDYSHLDFHPKARVEDVFPIVDRRYFYNTFEKSVGLKLPDLSLPLRLGNILFWTAFTAVLASIIFSIVMVVVKDNSGWWFLLPLLCLQLCISFSKLLDKQRVFISAPTIRDFCLQTLALNYNSVGNDSGVNKQEMEQVIRQIIADKHGFNLAEVTKEKKICDDLGID